MTNILNSHVNSTNNIIPAKKLNDTFNFQRCIEAPQSLPKYSINKVLQEKDEFRRSIKLEGYNAKKSKKGKLLKFGVILAAIAGFFVLKGKK